MSVTRRVSGPAPPFQVPVGLNVVLSYHARDRDVYPLGAAIESADVISPESGGLYRSQIAEWRSAYQGTEEQMYERFHMQLESGREDRWFQATLLPIVFNHPHIVALDFSPTEEDAQRMRQTFFGSSFDAINMFRKGEFEDALKLGFDTVDSRVKVYGTRHGNISDNALTELPPVVNKLKPKDGERVQVCILMGLMHSHVSDCLMEGLADAGDVTVNLQEVQKWVPTRFARLVKPLIGNPQPIDREDDANREQLARGLLECALFNFYPPNAPILLDGERGHLLLTQISDGFTVGEIGEICREAGGNFQRMGNFAWIKTLKNRGVKLLPAYLE